MAKERLNMAGVIVGRKGTGKSTFLNERAKAYYKAHPDKKVLIIDVNGSPAYKEHPELDHTKFARWNKGVYRFYDSDHKKMFDYICKHFKNGLIILEDCTKYIPANPGGQVKALLVDHRMWNADLIFTFHSFKRIPLFFWEMVSYVTILKTQEDFENSRNKVNIPNYEAVAAARKKVIAHKNPYYNLTVETLI
jgi:hypothetical protein